MAERLFPALFRDIEKTIEALRNHQNKKKPKLLPRTIEVSVVSKRPAQV